MKERLRQALPALVSLFLFLVALAVLRVELRAVHLHEITRDVLATAPPRLALALLLTAVNYLVLAGYDLIAFRYIGKTLPLRRIAAAAFLAYAVANTVGVAMLSGASVRYRFYSRWGVTAEELSKIIFSYSVTFWLGLLALGGFAFVVSPLAGDPALPGRGVLVVAGCLLMATVVGYLAATAFRTEPIRIRRFVLPLPGLAIAIRQLLVSSADWALAGAVLYVLLPPGHLSFFAFLGAFLIAVLLGMLSNVPGGVGVFEGLMVLLLRKSIPSGELLSALVVFRVVYYLLPFAVALVALVADEIHLRRAHVVRASRWFGRMTEWVTPKLLAAFTFLAGLVLLASGATPASPGRLDLLNRLLPLGLLELSHFVGSVAGAGLLVLSQGLARRLDVAYYLSSILIVVGVGASLLKGFDYEEALLLLAVLAMLRQSRAAFDRRAAFFETRFSGEWIAALVGGIGASVWLGFFAFAHVDYANKLWWEFELYGEASRFLRASVGASVVVLLAAIAWMMRAAPHEIEAPSAEDLADADRVIATQTSTTPILVHLRDKAVLFDESRRAFVMYGVQGRTWLALGDPVGPIDLVSTMIRMFLERCDDYSGTPAFYEIGTKHLHRYADFGLTFVKLGEEARVDLRAFTMQGGSAAKYRQVTRRLEKAGGTFRIAEVSEVASLMPSLRRVSDDWLAVRSAAEKGFSLGFFDEAYLERFPVAVVEKGGEVVAFANLWPGPGGVELSLDLMRYHREAPKDVMEALLIHTMLWGKERGYQWFALGMAPLSGFEASPLAPFWQRLGGFVYKHGEAVYSFQGLRGYKDKFNPVWEPRYLAYPGGLGLPRILADASALIAGGYRRIFLG
jgi:phosphatidylglycerol lysyltransferase